MHVMVVAPSLELLGRLQWHETDGFVGGACDSSRPEASSLLLLPWSFDARRGFACKINELFERSNVATAPREC